MATSFDVLTVSTKGQVVLPNEIRKNLSINAGDKMTVCCSDGVIVLKKLDPPDVKTFHDTVEKLNQYILLNGITEEDVFNSIKEYRAGNK